MWSLGAIACDAELIVSELVTNAVTAGAAVPFPARVGLYLAADTDRLTLLVWDSSPQPPVRRPHDHDAVAGRGLEIIEALSDRWGWSVPGDRGKVVWALLDLDGS